MKYLIYGPGRPFKALKQSAVSSVIHGPPSFESISPGIIQPIMAYQFSSSATLGDSHFLG